METTAAAAAAIPETTAAAAAAILGTTAAAMAISGTTAAAGYMPIAAATTAAGTLFQDAACLNAIKVNEPEFKIEPEVKIKGACKPVSVSDAKVFGSAAHEIVDASPFPLTISSKITARGYRDAACASQIPASEVDATIEAVVKAEYEKQLEKDIPGISPEQKLALHKAMSAKSTMAEAMDQGYSNGQCMPLITLTFSKPGYIEYYELLGHSPCGGNCGGQ